MKRIEIIACGLTGYLYTRNGVEWSFELGGFYDWHTDFKTAKEKAKEQMKRVAGVRIDVAFKKVKIC